MEQELAKRRGKEVDASEEEGKDQVDELYVVPDHLKVCIDLCPDFYFSCCHCY